MSKKICDPGMCDDCTYIGEGSFACMKDPSDVVIVMDGWEPTESYMHCEGGMEAEKLVFVEKDDVLRLLKQFTNSAKDQKVKKTLIALRHQINALVQYDVDMVDTDEDADDEESE